MSLFLDYNELFAIPGRIDLEVVSAEALSVALLAPAAFAKRSAGGELRSPSLTADANHMLVDVVEGGAVAAGLTAYMGTHNTVLYTATVAVALLGLLLAAYEAGHDSLKALLDIPKDRGELEKIRAVAEEAMGGAGEVRDVKARWAGPVIFVEVLLKLHPLLTIEEASLYAEKVKTSVYSAVEGVRDVAVRIEPARRKDLVVAVPLDRPEPGSRISGHLGRAPYFALYSVKDGVVTGLEIVGNPALRKPEDVSTRLLRGARVAEFLFKRGATDVITCSIGEIAYAILLRHQIMVWNGLCGKSAEENLRALIRGYLALLREPTREESWERYGGGRPGSGVRPM